MEARSAPEAFKLIMKQRRCSQNQLARDLRKGSGWISDVINGKAGREFARMIEILSRVGLEVVIRPKREESDPVKRREFVTGAASVMFVPSPKVGPHEDPSYLEELTRRVARARYEHGGGATASTAIKHIRLIEPLIISKDRKLQEVGANLAAEAAWTLNDARRFDAGENVGGLALTLARRSGSTDAQSRAYSVLAEINVERGRRDRAFRFAAAGADLREVPDAQAQWMKLRKGWVQAHVRGQGNAARTEIDTVLGRLRDTGGFYGQSRLDVADMTGNLGNVLADLGAYGEAQEVLRHAVHLFGESSPMPVALCLAHQSIAALSGAEVDQAADRMLTLARFTPLIDSPRVDGQVRKILTVSARWGAVPYMRDARDQLNAGVHPNSRA
jgi:transcriptional regulator with XRE-family HTH domain